MPTTECGFTGRPVELVVTGPTLDVQIGFDPVFRLGTNVPPNIPGDGHPALVDTGAALSCIDADLVAALSLPVIDHLPVAGVHGSQVVTMHLAQIWVPALEWTVSGPFAAVRLAAGAQLHKALIGRNFLQYFRLLYEGRTGAVTLSND